MTVKELSDALNALAVEGSDTANATVCVDIYDADTDDLVPVTGVAFFHGDPEARLILRFKTIAVDKVRLP